MTNIKRINRQYQGFTLIETLIVLLISILIIGLPALLVEQTTKNISINQFFVQFEKQLLYTQQMATVGERDTTVLFSETEQRVHFSTMEERVLTIPVGLILSGPEKITFKQGTGNNGSLSNYHFEWYEKGVSIEFQFQMGNGRYVKKINKL